MYVVLFQTKSRERMSSYSSNYLRLLSFTRLLTSHVNHGHHNQAISLFHHLHSTFPLDPHVFPLVLKSCAATRSRQLGETLHSHIAKSSYLTNPFVACALISMYGKCGSISSARQLFDEIPNRNVVVWNAMISLYSSTKDMKNALKLFEVMDVEPDASTFNSMMSGFSETAEGGFEGIKFYQRMKCLGLKLNLITILALLHCSLGITALSMIKEIHGFSIRNSIDPNVQFRSRLVDVYGRCGCLEYACRVFSDMKGMDVIAWSSLISAYALHGEARIALQMFEQMELDRVKPDRITFLGVLKACSHAGLADEARWYFTRMHSDYGLEPTSEHYSCLVDALSRAGRLYEAYDVIREMPVKVTASAWGALLGACRTHGEVELAEIAGRALFEIEPHNVANYVLLARIYASAGRYEQAQRMKKEMTERRLKAAPGSSWFMYQD